MGYHIDEDETKPINHYVDNEKLSQLMIEWKKQYVINEKLGLDRPPIPEYVGYSIMMIAKRKGTAHNFRNYTYLDEMMGYAIEVVFRYLHRFDETAETKKGGVNTFGYFDYIINNAFLYVMDKEEREQYYKNKSFELYGLDELYDPNVEGASQDIMNRVYEYEEKMEKRKVETRERNKLRKGDPIHIPSLFDFVEV